MKVLKKCSDTNSSKFVKKIHDVAKARTVLIINNWTIILSLRAEQLCEEILYAMLVLSWTEKSLFEHVVTRSFWYIRVDLYYTASIGPVHTWLTRVELAALALSDTVLSAGVGNFHDVTIKDVFH